MAAGPPVQTWRLRQGLWREGTRTGVLALTWEVIIYRFAFDWEPCEYLQSRSRAFAAAPTDTASTLAALPVYVEPNRESLAADDAIKVSVVIRV